MWSFVHKAVELDEAKRAEGSDLDEFQAHRFLEHFKETLTVQVPTSVPAHHSSLPAPLFASFFLSPSLSLFLSRCCLGAN